MRRRYIVMCGVVVSATVLAFPARSAADDSSGVSPNRIKLPKGPGSLEGIGENAEPNLNMGLMSYGVPITVPAGYGGMTPSLRLAYDSGAGDSIVGLGWSLSLPSIERMTSRGLPRYVQADSFVANGGSELVRLAMSDVYRERYEAGFVRYRWIDEQGAGRAGYWTAEFPDGRIGYFGAHADGSEAPDARVAGLDGVFRYHLSEMVDPLGHRIIYEYVKDAALSHPSRISYVFEGDDPRYEVLFSYADRSDQISDGKPGFELRCTKRLVSIEVRVHGQQLRRYAFGYDPASPGLSRLAAVRQYGLGDEGPYPIAFQFGYSGGLGEACAAGMCNSPEVVRIASSVDFDFRAGTAEFVDLNGDALPDIVDTAGPRHRIFLNLYDDGGQRLSDPIESATGAENLSARNVQLFDVDGDGFADMVNAQTRSVLYSAGDGDWLPAQTVDALELPDFTTDADARFFDFDNDKRIDVVHSDGTSTWYHRNQGDGTFGIDEDVPALGVGFSEDGLQLADMNGDGLQDLVQVAQGAVSYRMYLGYGRFADWVEVDNAPEVPAQELRLWDLNGDSLADAVHVAVDTVTFALNSNGRAFEATPTTLSASDALPFPETTAEVSVRFADMNGSGSTDIVWIDAAGAVTYLELFPHRPNLLTRIDNGIGKVIELDYGSSAEHMAADGGPGAWSHRVPSPMLTIDAIATYDTLSGVRQARRFRYHEGFWDGEEKQFRGFARVEALTAGDSRTEPGEVRHEFEVGQNDPYRKGLLLRQTTSSGSRELAIQENEYEDCPVDGIPADTSPAVRFICQSASVQTLKEGAPEEQWVRVEEAYVYDGYGNRTEVRKHGVTDIGGGSCPACDRDADAFGAPCGMQCLGDEAFEATVYVRPDDAGGRWIVNKPATKRHFGASGSMLEGEERYHYDGEPFEGLPTGQLTQGLLTRVEVKERADGARFVQKTRAQHDAHGAVVAAMDANGHRRRFEYDEASLLLRAESIVFDDPDHTAYELRTEVSHDPVLETVVRSSNWRRVVDGEAVSPSHDTEYSYDVFGRLSAVARPGDALSTPSEAYRYDLGDPVSRIVRRASSAGGEAPDIEEIQCFDGLGRATQTRTRIEPGRYQVAGFTVFSTAGKETLVYQPYVSTSDRCDRAAPGDALFEESTYDATGRVLTTTHPDAETHGSASMVETRYGPLRVDVFDEEDSDPASHHAGTPLVTWANGLGRTVAIDRHLSPTKGIRIGITYDALGNLRGYRDANGNERVQQYDLLGRVLEVIDPDSGRTSLDYDDVGNVVARTDGRGDTTSYRYDEAGRLLSEWEASDESATRIDYRYDAAGDCERCTNLDGMISEVRYPFADGEPGVDRFGYDDRGRSVYFSRELEGHDFEFTTKFDNADRIVARRYPGGHEIRYRPDAAGRLIGIPGYLPSIAYDERGLKRELQFGNGVVTTYGYDERLRLRAIDTEAAGGESILAHRYLRDRVGNIGRLADESAVDGLPSASAEYRYDAWYRLTSARLDRGREPEETIELAYDDIDNILTKTSDRGADSRDHTGSYAYDAARPHAAIRAGDVALRYDAAGNLLWRGDDRFEWDYAGRLVRVTRDDEALATMTYGPSRDRIKKVEGSETTYYVSPDFEVRDGLPTIYLRAGDQPVAKIELDGPAPILPDLAPADVVEDVVTPEPDGQITAGDAWIAAAIEAEIFHGEAVDKPPNPDALLAASARRLVAGPDTRVTYLHVDHLHSTAATTDAAGQTISRGGYYPFGEIRLSHGGLEDYSFTAKEQDTATRLSYHGARYLLPQLGRWSSPDPAFTVLGADALEKTFEAANPYAYVLNAPIGARDPFGTETVGELIERKGVAAAGRDDSVSTAAWAFAQAAWDVFGAEAVSKVADHAGGRQGELSTSDKVMAGVQVAGALAGPIAKGISKGVSALQAAKSSAWALKPFARGVAIENALGRNLPGNFPVIDRFSKGIATSIKSLDLDAKTYQSASALSRTVTGYIDNVAAFGGRTWGGATVRASEITGRALELAIPAGRGTAAQQGVLQATVQYGQSVGVSVRIIPF